VDGYPEMEISGTETGEGGDVNFIDFQERFRKTI
jgi:hypothetical protein